MAVEWVQGNALELPFADATFDAATVGFGVRNVADLPRAISEMARVVRPGGRVAILEITTPQRPPLKWFFSVWFDRIVPLLGTVAGDREAYTYLPSSVRRFPPAHELAQLMHSAGLRDVRYVVLAGGIVAIHSGRLPAAERAMSAVDDLVLLGGDRMPGLIERTERRLEGIASGHGEVLADAAAGTLAAGRQAPAAAARPAVRRRERGRGVRCAPPPRSSWSTWPRWSTTTSWTVPPCGGDEPRCSRPGAGRPRPRPATSCSRARSLSSPRTTTSTR